MPAVAESNPCPPGANANALTTEPTDQIGERWSVLCDLCTYHAQDRTHMLIIHKYNYHSDFFHCAVTLLLNRKVSPTVLTSAFVGKRRIACGAVSSITIH
jgi:hypothetical protein